MVFSGFWRRFFAHLIDMVLFFGTIVLVGLFIAWSMGAHSLSLENLIRNALEEVNYLYGTFISFWVTFAHGPEAFDSFLHNATTLNVVDLRPPLPYYILNTLMVLLFCVYKALFESSFLQATPGKLMLAIKVISIYGQPLRFGQAFKRQLLTLLCDITLGLGYLLVLATRRKQGLHDKIAGTLVVLDLSAQEKYIAWLK